MTISLDRFEAGVETILHLPTYFCQLFVYFERRVLILFFYILICLAINLKHAFSCVQSDCLPSRRQSHTDRICLAFFHCGFSNGSSKHLGQSMCSHIGCTFLTFLHCVILNVSPNRLPVRMHSHTECICGTFLHRVFSYASSKHLGYSMHSHIGCFFLPFLHCVFSNVHSN